MEKIVTHQLYILSFWNLTLHSRGSLWHRATISWCFTDTGLQTTPLDSVLWFKCILILLHFS